MPLFYLIPAQKLPDSMKQFLHIAYCFLSIFFFQLQGCSSDNVLFTEISSSTSGINFRNAIAETDSINVLEYEYVYNGGGVGIGDFNRDGLADIYFTGSIEKNGLYLNKGNFRFQDITRESRTEGGGSWCTGTAVVDINNDGWQDIYVCTTKKNDPGKRRNILYVNKGLNKNGIPFFQDEAREYGLADTSY